MCVCVIFCLVEIDVGTDRVIGSYRPRFAELGLHVGMQVWYHAQAGAAAADVGFDAGMDRAPSMSSLC